MLPQDSNTFNIAVSREGRPVAQLTGSYMFRNPPRHSARESMIPVVQVTPATATASSASVAPSITTAKPATGASTIKGIFISPPPAAVQPQSSPRGGAPASTAKK